MKGTIIAEKGIITTLQLAQEEHGYLPEDILEKIAEESNVPLSQVYGVVTFYTQFSLKPLGKHIIKICRGTACHVKGAQSLINYFEKKLNVKEGDTTEDRLFTLEGVACVGTCFLAPVMMIDDSYYGELNYEKIDQVIAEYYEKSKA